MPTRITPRRAYFKVPIKGKILTLHQLKTYVVFEHIYFIGNSNQKFVFISNINLHAIAVHFTGCPYTGNIFTFKISFTAHMILQ
jgi:hypothetical protein